MSARRPNVLWLMTDEQRTDSLGCYGSRWARSPNIDRLAREGALFERAVTPSPVCLPARTSIMTGAYPSQLGVWHNDVDRRQPLPNLMSQFHQAGYQTASFGKQDYVGAGSAFEVEGGGCCSSEVHYYRYAPQYDEREYDVIKYPGEIYNWIFGGRFPEDASHTTEFQAIDLGLQWLESRDPERPFFLRISFNGPHTPVVPPAPFDQIIDSQGMALPPEAEGVPEGQPSWLSEELAIAASAAVLSPEAVHKMRRCYYGEVAFLDSQFGRLLDWMEAQGLLENTVVAYTTDHGTHLGDYGLVQKQTFYDVTVNVPYLFWCPGRIAAGTRIGTPVETRSLLPTLLDLAGLEGGAESLGEVLSSGCEPPARPVFSELTLASFKPHVQHEGRLVMVRDGNWKLSACLDPQVHDLALHDLAGDPYERRNLANDPRSDA